MNNKIIIFIIIAGIIATIIGIVAINLKKQKESEPTVLDGKSKEQLITEVENLAANPNNLPGLNSLTK